jgi:hypothetical protein
VFDFPIGFVALEYWKLAEALQALLVEIPDSKQPTHMFT